MSKGDVVLIHAGASGVGTAAIQLVKEFGAHPIVTAGSNEKLDACLSLGAKQAINYKNGPLVSDVMGASNNRGVDIILDFVGASYWANNLESIAPDGRWILVGSLGGYEVDRVNLKEFLRKRI
jgi:tumor protein p53-inducible protein 3